MVYFDTIQKIIAKKNTSYMLHVILEKNFRLEFLPNLKESTSISKNDITIMKEDKYADSQKSLTVNMGPVINKIMCVSELNITNILAILFVPFCLHNSYRTEFNFCRVLDILYIKSPFLCLPLPTFCCSNMFNTVWIPAFPGFMTQG